MRKCQPLCRRPRDSPPMLTQRDQLLSHTPHPNNCLSATKQWYSGTVSQVPESSIDVPSSLLVGSAAPSTERSPDNDKRRPRSFTSRPGLRHCIAITKRHDPNQHARFHGQPSTNTPLCRGTAVADERDPVYGFTDTRQEPSLPPKRPAASQIRIRPSRRREEAITASLRRSIQSVGKEP
jgi:hypothetical protein